MKGSYTVVWIEAKNENYAVQITHTSPVPPHLRRQISAMEKLERSDRLRVGEVPRGEKML